MSTMTKERKCPNCDGHLVEYAKGILTCVPSENEGAKWCGRTYPIDLKAEQGLRRAAKRLADDDAKSTDNG